MTNTLADKSLRRVAARNGKKGGRDLAAYLRDLDPEWNLVGRVTFHLAENKKNESKPFAFLATYTDDRAKSRSPQHIPLAEALKQSIESGDSERLDQLLQPVSRAAGESELVKELLESRALFSPQAWTIQRAFAFLSAVPAMERARSDRSRTELVERISTASPTGLRSCRKQTRPRRLVRHRHSTLRST